MCGEEEYDSEHSALGDEVDDTKEVLQRLSVLGGVKSTSKVMPSIEVKEVVDGPSEPAKHADSANPDKESLPAGEVDQWKARTQKNEYGDSQFSDKAKIKRQPRGASLSQQPETPTKVGKTASQSKLEVQEPRVSQDISAVAAKSNADQEAETRVQIQAKRRARKKARRKAERSGQEAQENSNEIPAQEPDDAAQDVIVPPPKNGPNDPKSEVEAHQNLLISQKRDAHEHGPTATKSEKEQTEAEKRSAAFDAELRAARDLASEHAFDLYSQGKHKGASREFREEMKRMAAERQAREKDKEKSAKAGDNPKKRKKRNSTMSEKTLEQHVPTKKQRKSKGDMKPSDSSISAKSDFRSPMIQ